MATSNYVPNTWLLGSIDLTSVVTAGNLGAPFATTTLPSVTIEQQLGQIVGAWASNSLTSSFQSGWAEFIFLAVPVSTTVTAGLFYTWDASTFSIALAPTTVANAAASGFPLCVAYNAVTSNATSIQYTWFQVTGRASVFRSPSKIVSSLALPVFVSGTTGGKLQATASTLRTIIGARFANTATVVSATSAITVYLNRPNIGPGK
jgi:hypothetical protein